MDKKRILLVDDDHLYREILDSYLNLILDCQVVSVANGQAALSQLQQQSFDLLLTDYHMPDMNGLILAEAARQIIPDIPVVLMTGAHNGREIYNRLCSLNRIGFLAKPFYITQLKDILQNNGII
ncbi:MAG: response regulator [Anaerolineae bacterium]|nr:response regulator [Anaerolineae bacterium]